MTPAEERLTRRIAARPPKGSLERALDRISSPSDRRRQHNTLVADAITQFDEYTLGGVRVVPTSEVHIDPETKLVEVRCFAFDAETGEEIVHVDGRFQFERPPFRVFDGNWRKEEDQLRPNLKEDVLQAFREALVVSICAAAGRPAPTFIPLNEPRYVTDALGYRITNTDRAVPPPEIDGVWQPYGDPPPGETWKERE